MEDTAGGYSGGSALNYSLEQIRLSDIKERAPAVLQLCRFSLIQK